MRSSHVKRDNSSFVTHPGQGQFQREHETEEGSAMTAISHQRLSFLHQSAKPNHVTGRATGLARQVARTLRLWRRRAREREALQQLSYRDMRDIGVTPADIAWEVSQPFWREPRQR